MYGLCTSLCVDVSTCVEHRAQKGTPMHPRPPGKASPLGGSKTQQSRLHAPQGWGCRHVPDAWFVPATLDLTSSADCTASSLCRAISADPKSSMTH